MNATDVGGQVGGHGFRVFVAVLPESVIREAGYHVGTIRARIEDVDQTIGLVVGVEGDAQKPPFAAGLHIVEGDESSVPHASIFDDPHRRGSHPTEAALLGYQNAVGGCECHGNRKIGKGNDSLGDESAVDGTARLGIARVGWTSW